MLDSYRVGNAGAMKRIGTPHEHDVLSGRGGAINSHLGNTKFREWVRERKNRYNLARTKAEKASVANEVMDLVRNQSPPGRFLQRDQSSVTGGVTWWVEVDEIKAMAKTSQALREGAPSIRAAHKDELTVKKRTRKTNKKSQSTAQETTAVTGKRRHQEMQQQRSMTLAPPAVAAVTSALTTAPALEPVGAPLAPVVPMTQAQAIQQLKANAEAAGHIDTSSTQFPSYTPSTPAVAPLPLLTSGGTTASSIQPPVKRSRLSENLYLPITQPQPHIVRPDDETPPLAPLPSPIPLSSIPEMNESFPMPAIPKRETCSLRRANSLALSDVGSGGDNWGDVEFVNPFEGDTNDEITTMPPITSPFDAVYSNNGSSNGSRSRGSMSNLSVKSELSDLGDIIGLTSVGTKENSYEFGEAMKDVYDAVNPGLASTDDEPIPTHLYPFRGSHDLIKRGSGGPQLIY